MVPMFLCTFQGRAASFDPVLVLESIQYPQCCKYPTLTYVGSEVVQRSPHHLNLISYLIQHNLCGLKLQLSPVVFYFCNLETLLNMFDWLVVLHNKNQSLF